MSATPAITFGSVCSGIEAASVAWAPLGWRAAWLAEVDPFACAVLAHHHPDVPNLGDMTTIAARVLAGSVPAPDDCPDGPRYRALGNSWPVPVVTWIGRRMARHMGPRDA